MTLTDEQARLLYEILDDVGGNWDILVGVCYAMAQSSSTGSRLTNNKGLWRQLFNPATDLVICSAEKGEEPTLRHVYHRVYEWRDALIAYKSLR